MTYISTTSRLQNWWRWF